MEELEDLRLPITDPRQSCGVVLKTKCKWSDSPLISSILTLILEASCNISDIHGCWHEDKIFRAIDLARADLLEHQSSGLSLGL